MAHKVVSGVYKIVNKVNGHFYVGSSNSVRRRWYEHRRALRAGRHGNRYLQAAWQKYGEGVFTFEELETGVDVALLLQREAWHVERLQPAYNLAPVIQGKFTHEVSETVREKIRRSKLGTRHSPETRALMSASAKARGIPQTTRDAQKAAVTGRPRSPEVRAKIAAGHLGLTPSAETREKIRQSLLARNKD